MLFDLRARGRRRTVQAVYLGLAILFGLGFVGFGVGGGFGGGGVVEGLFGNKEGSATSSYAKQVASAEQRTRKHPGEAAAWASLASAQIHEAGGSEFFNEAAQQFTAEGKSQLAKAASSWTRYRALKPKPVDLAVAQEMLRVYSPEGLNQPADVVKILKLVIAGKPPSAALYGQLASFSYLAKETHQGDVAAAKTLKLTPAAQRATVKAQLEQIKKGPTAGATGGATTTTKGTVNGAQTESGETLTTTGGATPKTGSAKTGSGETLTTNGAATPTGTSTSTTPAPAKKK